GASGCDTPRRTRTQYRYRNTLDECPLSSSKRSAKYNRAELLTQGMKSSDALLAAWQRTVGSAKDSPAILNTRGEVVRKFSEIDECARVFGRKIEAFKAGSVIGVQIGNHEDWASILIACVRRHLVVLPLEQSISDQQRD